MSVTFSVEGLEEEHGYDLPCPDCGDSMMTAVARSVPLRDCSCMGYGGPIELPRPRFEMNLTNRNALVLLEWLDLPVQDGTLEGATDGQDLLTTLAVKETSQLVELLAAARDEFDVQQDVARLAVRYVRLLSRIAQRAAKWGRSVIWI